MEKFIVIFITTLIKILFCTVGVYLIWNGFMGVKFGLPPLSFVEALILCALGSLIAGS